MASSNLILNNGNGKKVTLTNPDANMEDKVVDISKVVDTDSTSLVPVGATFAYPIGTPPPGYLEWNGATLSRTAYSKLFAVIGTTFGAGDGSTTFKIADLRGEFIRGWDHGRGIDIGRIIGSFQGDAIRNIIGSFVSGGTNPNTTSSTGAFAAATIDTGTYTYNTSGANEIADRYDFSASRVVPTAADNRPRNISMMYCFKY